MSSTVVVGVVTGATVGGLVTTSTILSVMSANSVRDRVAGDEVKTMRAVEERHYRNHSRTRHCQMRILSHPGAVACGRVALLLHMCEKHIK